MPCGGHLPHGPLVHLLRTGTWAVPVQGIWKHVASDTHVQGSGLHIFWEYTGRWKAGGQGRGAQLQQTPSPRSLFQRWTCCSHPVSHTRCHPWSMWLFSTLGVNCYLRVLLIHNSVISSEAGCRFIGGMVPR